MISYETAFHKYTASMPINRPVSLVGDVLFIALIMSVSACLTGCMVITLAWAGVGSNINGTRDWQTVILYSYRHSHVWYRRTTANDNTDENNEDKERKLHNRISIDIYSYNFPLTDTSLFALC